MQLTAKQQKLVEDNMGLAGQFAKYGEDVAQNAFLGLCRAAVDFDDEVAKFSTYATWWIKSFVNRAMSTNKIPEYIKADCRKYSQLKMSGMTDCEIREAMGNPNNFDNIATYANVELSSLDAPDLHGNSRDVADYRESDESPDIAVFLNRLDGRDREIIEMRFGIVCEPMTLQEIADHYGLTRERVRQIEAKALDKMRQI